MMHLSVLRSLLSMSKSLATFRARHHALSASCTPKEYLSIPPRSPGPCSSTPPPDLSLKSMLRRAPAIFHSAVMTAAACLVPTTTKRCPFRFVGTLITVARTSRLQLAIFRCCVSATVIHDIRDVRVARATRLAPRSQPSSPYSHTHPPTFWSCVAGRLCSACALASSSAVEQHAGQHHCLAYQSAPYLSSGDRVVRSYTASGFVVGTSVPGREARRLAPTNLRLSLRIPMRATMRPTLQALASAFLGGEKVSFLPLKLILISVLTRFGRLIGLWSVCTSEGSVIC